MVVPPGCVVHPMSKCEVDDRRATSECARIVMEIECRINRNSASFSIFAISEEAAPQRYPRCVGTCRSSDWRPQNPAN
jgi:hypothetical protein